MEEKYGEVEEMNVCDNLGDHLVGNVYVKVRVGTNTDLCYNFCAAVAFCVALKPAMFCRLHLHMVASLVL